MDTLKPQSNGSLYSNTVIGTLAVDWWADTFGTARRGTGPRTWNKLPPPLRRVYSRLFSFILACYSPATSPSPATFKRQLKTFLYNHAFNSHR